VVNRQTLGGPPAAALSPEDLARLRADLLEQRLFRREQLRQLAASRPSRAGGPRREAAARAEVRAKLAASARMVLADVEAALARMAEGRYGSCHLCRRPLPLEHLTIVPQARYCDGCRRGRDAER
jgi:RNA polymerase-binding transcription factor DksA